MNEETGIIYNVQRFNLHDGPGIRTIIFLKGCPLHCLWCANPESQAFEPEAMGQETVGYRADVRELMDVVLRDQPFYRRSGGGLTLSGGEPLSQPAFTHALLSAAKAEGLHTAMESSCFSGEEVFAHIVAQTDYLLADIKAMDSGLHEKLTGVPNGGILKNICLAAKVCARVVVRVPVIPGCNDSWENLSSTAEFCDENGISSIELLAYHKLGISKYERLGRVYQLPDVSPPGKDTLQRTAKRLEEQFSVRICVI